MAPSFTNRRPDLGFVGIRVDLLTEDCIFVGGGKLGGNPWKGPIVGISPCYRGRNGSLPSIGRKGRFLLENA